MTQEERPTYREILGVSEADTEELVAIEDTIDRLFPGYKGAGEGAPYHDMVTVLLMLVAQLRVKVRQLETVAHAPLGQDEIYDRLARLEALAVCACGDLTAPGIHGRVVCEGGGN